MPKDPTARADVVEQDGAEIAFKCGRHKTPHVLIAAKSVGKDDCALTRFH